MHLEAPQIQHFRSQCAAHGLLSREMDGKVQMVMHAGLGKGCHPAPVRE